MKANQGSIEQTFEQTVNEVFGFDDDPEYDYFILTHSKNANTKVPIIEKPPMFSTNLLTLFDEKQQELTQLEQEVQQAGTSSGSGVQPNTAVPLPSAPPSVPPQQHSTIVEAVVISPQAQDEEDVAPPPPPNGPQANSDKTEETYGVIRMRDMHVLGEETAEDQLITKPRPRKVARQAAAQRVLLCPLMPKGVPCGGSR